MSNKSDSKSRDAAGFPKADLRIDQPHAHGAAHLQSAGPAVQLVGAGVAERSQSAGAVEHSLEQLREHAAQLADRLQLEQSELDRRQNALAAQEADLEAKWQNARQWLT